MGAFLLTLMYFFIDLHRSLEHYNRFVIAVIIKIVTEVKCLCSTLEKPSLSLGFFFSNCICLSARAATNNKI